MLDVLLDANFLVLPFQTSVDLESEFDRLLDRRYRLHTLHRTYNEALDLEDGQYRQLVERLVEHLDISIEQVDAQGSVDDVLFQLSDRYIVCTNDKGLRGRLRDNNRPVIYLRQRNHLAADHLPPGR